MVKKIAFCCIATMCCLISAANANQWSLYRQAQIKNSDNNHLRFDCTAGKSLRAWLILGKAAEKAFAERLPLYKIDDQPVRNLQKFEGIQTDKDKTRWIYWEVCDGKGGTDLFMREFMNGKEVVFQYYLPNGEIRETAF
ncbi:MAG: hypothetical protein JW884_08820, partial [Deltaproteobacteria bacterium]|nr:hypothetical protein [Deltaproteobacteria bacterium]